MRRAGRTAAVLLLAVTAHRVFQSARRRAFVAGVVEGTYTSCALGAVMGGCGQ